MGAPTNRHRHIGQARIVSLLNSGEKTVHINMNYFAHKQLWEIASNATSITNQTSSNINTLGEKQTSNHREIVRLIDS